MILRRHHEDRRAECRPEFARGLAVGGGRRPRGRHDRDPAGEQVGGGGGRPAPVAKALSRVAAATEKLLAALEKQDRRKLVALLAAAKEGRDAVGS